MKTTSHDAAQTGTLYVVATPIGNLADITLRAIETLQTVSLIACEDTRTSGVLCRHHQITTPLIAYHEHNESARLPEILSRLRDGASIALISDAGTPLISDPGYRLVRAAAQAEIHVVPIPGACALIAALSAAGLPTDQFMFAGFLPAKANARRTALEALAAQTVSVIMYESPKRLLALLEDIAALVPDRAIVVAREMTKHYEEITRLNATEMLHHYRNKPSIKGEIVVCMAPADSEAATPQHYHDVLVALLAHYPVKQAVNLITNVSDVNRNALYEYAVALKSG